jgi:holin-like protein
MLRSFLILLLFQFIGEAVYRIFSLPLPGPVIGMALLALWLMRRPPEPDGPLQTTASYLLQIMGLLFVPAGVGIVANLPLLRAQWLPIALGLFGSTLLSLLGTAWVMHWFSLRSKTQTAMVNRTLEMEDEA